MITNHNFEPFADTEPDSSPDSIPTPTHHPPGSPGKVEALARRAELGQQLWHPDDCGSRSGEYIGGGSEPKCFHKGYGGVRSDAIRRYVIGGVAGRLEVRVG